jgi:hypothetical protein
LPFFNPWIWDGKQLWILDPESPKKHPGSHSKA